MLDYQYTNLLNHDKSHLHVNNCKVIFNIIKAVFGIGLLSISYTIKLSGWSFLVPLCVISLITCYNAYNIGYLVKEFTNHYNNLVNYPNICQKIYGKKFKIFVEILWNLEIYMISLIFLNLVSSLLMNIVCISRVESLLICTGIFILISFIKDYSKISIVSMGGFLSMLVLVVCMYVKYFENSNKKKIIEYGTFSIKTISQSIGISLFSFGGHVILPEILDTLKKKEDLKKVILSSWLIITLLTISFSVIGFLYYGNNIQPNIIDNLSYDIFKQILVVSLFISIIFTYPLICIPFMMKAEERVNCLLARILYNGSLFFISYYWVSFLSIMSITGCIFENITSLILPPILMLKYKQFHWIEKILNIFILCFGIIFLVLATYYEIYNK